MYRSVHTCKQNISKHTWEDVLEGWEGIKEAYLKKATDKDRNDFELQRKTEDRNASQTGKAMVLVAWLLASYFKQH